MLKRVSLVSLFYLLTAASSFAQRNPRSFVRSTSRVAPHSIIVKFRTDDAVSKLSVPLADALKGVAAKSVQELSPMFPNRRAKLSIQSVATSFGLERIVLVPLKDGVSPEEAVALLTGYSEIEYVEPNYIYHIEDAPTRDIINPDDSLYHDQWYLKTIDVAGAWEVTQGDSSVRIGFVDTGVDWNHPDLVGQFAVNPLEDINHNGLFDAWPSTEKRMNAHGDSVFGDLDGVDEDGNGFIDDVIGYDFVDQESLNYGDASGRDPMPQDENDPGHGTLVAGVLCARQNNRIGISGIAPKCKLVALRAFDFAGNAEDDDVAAAIVYAADNNVKILNLSFGDVVPSLLQRDAIRYATARGTLIFASSGNSGGDRRHYPSDFDECVSVGMSLAPPLSNSIGQISEFSEGMDLVAPGDRIMSLTARDSGYSAAYSGTSFSAPITAGVAALLLSARPSLSPTEIRSIIESTTDDIEFSGYDHLAANGRLNASKALHYLGSAAIKITSPKTDQGFKVGDVIPVTGFAVSTLFQKYSVSFAAGINPDHTASNVVNDQSVWIPIVEGTGQIENGLLGTWRTTGLKPGYYTVRLALQSSDLRSTEERVTVVLSAVAPTLTAFEVDSIYANEKRALLVQATTDVVTSLQLYFRPQAGGRWAVKTDDRYLHSHAMLLTSAEAPAGVPLELFYVLRNAAGDSVGGIANATILNDDISEKGFNEKSYALPAGYALNTILHEPIGDEVVLSVFPNGLDFGPLNVFEFDSLQRKFLRLDSSSLIGVPRAIGSTRGDSGPELLVQAGGQSVIFKPNASHKLLGDVIFDNSGLKGISAGGLADVDGDGRAAIIGTVSDTSGANKADEFEAVKWNGSAYTVLGQLPDTTAPEPGSAANGFSDQHVAVADFLGDGREEIVTVDADADLIAYKRDQSSADGFSPFFTDENNGISEGAMLTTGDFNGDGLPDIALAFHRSFQPDDLFNEYPANYWTLKVYLNLGGGKFSVNTLENFFFAKDPTVALYRSGLQTIPSVTGRGAGDCLALSVFPNFYLFEFDNSVQRIKPVWHYGLSITGFGAIAHDFDRNGRIEFGFYAGDSIRFFESDSAYENRTATPGGLSVVPRDSNRVDLSWSPVKGASSYNVLRADDGSSTFNSVRNVATNSFIDTEVVNHNRYIYSVTAIDPSKTVTESENAFSISCLVHPTPRIDSIFARGTSLRLHVTEPISTRALTGGPIVVDDSISASTISTGSDSVFLATLESRPVAGVHNLRVRSFELRDAFNSPFDTSRLVTFSNGVEVEARRFYIVRWEFEGSSLIHVVFNLKPSDDALEISHYSLSPYGTLIRIERDPQDSLALIIHLDPSTEVVALGTPFVLCVTGIHDELRDDIQPTEGNCAGVTLTEPDLTKVLVYPNPAKHSDGAITFARLTASAEISIYTQGMKFLRRIESGEKNGGVQWDMKDENGHTLPSGIYLYHVTGKNDSGNDVAPQEAKFVIIGDR